MEKSEAIKTKDGRILTNKNEIMTRQKDYFKGLIEDSEEMKLIDTLDHNQEITMMELDQPIMKLKSRKMEINYYFKEYKQSRQGRKDT